MSLAWVAEQIKTAMDAANARPQLIRFNPRPPGVIREGSATDAVLLFLKSNPRRYYTNGQLMEATGKSHAAVSWALLYLRDKGLINSIPDDERNALYLRYCIAIKE